MVSINCMQIAYKFVFFIEMNTVHYDIKIVTNKFSVESHDFVNFFTCKNFWISPNSYSTV